MTFSINRLQALQAFKAHSSARTRPRPRPRLRSPTRSSSTFASLRSEIISRPHHIIYDHLSPTPSHLLNISLADFLPPSCHPPPFNPSRSLALPVPSTALSTAPLLLPPGHHLVYFPAQIPRTALLPDGTDNLHSPGAPFTRRMWAGGAVFCQRALPLNGQRAVCVEGIRDVTLKGREGEGDEKIIVHVERRIGLTSRDTTGQEEILRLWTKDPDAFGESAIVERRSLVFMKEHNKQSTGPRPGTESLMEKTVKASNSSPPPDFSITLTPDRALLFRFSALTFNAHAIHLDQLWAQEVEGFRNLVVHGPLTLALMMAVLASRLQVGERISSFSYRNLAPLYVDEEMRVCVRREGKERKEDAGRYVVWIEGKTGRYAVRGTASVEKAG